MAAPIVSPEGYSISFYSLPNWDNDHSTSPHSYGNRGMALYQSHTEADGKAHLRDNECYGHFAAVERINGRIGKSWHVEIEPLEEETNAEDLSLLDDVDLDDGDLLDPARVRDKIKIAKLEAEIKAASRNGHSSSPMMERLFEQLLSEKLQRVDPLDELVAREEKAERLRAIYAPPRRESNPAPAQPQRSEEEIIASAVFKHPEVIETVIDSALKRFGNKEGGDVEPWYAEPIKDAVKTGQAAAIVRELFSGAQGFAQGLIGNLFSMSTPKSTQTPAQQAPQQPQQTAPVQAPQPQQQVAPTNVEQPAQALPETTQQPQAQASQSAQANQQTQMLPIDALIHEVVELMKRDAPIAEAVNVVNIACVRYSAFGLGDSVDQLLDLPVDQILAMLNAYSPGASQMPHAKTWLESLINALAGEDGDFDQFVELDSRKDEVKL